MKGEKVIDQRKIRKVMVFFEDDTRAPAVVDGSGMFKKIDTTVTQEGHATEPVTYYEVIMNPS